MNEKDKLFSDIVKDTRKKLGLSQQNLADELGISFATINRWENGRTKPFHLARVQFESFCEKMVAQRKLKNSNSR